MGSMRTPAKPTVLDGAGAAPLLKASITTLAPFTARTTELSAAGPHRKLTTPSLNVSCAQPPPAAKRNAIAKKRFIPDPPPKDALSVTFPPHENLDGRAARGAAFRKADAVLRRAA